MLVAYSLGAITKAFFPKIPRRFIPIQNLLIGFLSGLICFFAKIEANLLVSIGSCLMSTLSAGGIFGLMDITKNETENKANTLE